MRLSRCTITLTLLALAACAPTVKYEPAPEFRADMNCRQLAQAENEARDHLISVQARRARITDEDIAGFILDFGAMNNVAGSLAEKAAKERLDAVRAARVGKRCTIT